MAREDVFPASWVNEAYWRYHAAKAEEDQERVASLEAKASLQLETDVMDETQILAPLAPALLPSEAEQTQVLAGALEKSKALDTERMRRRDWVDLQRAAAGKTSLSREAYEGPGLISFVGMVFLALLLMGLVWWGASWIMYA